MVEIVGSGDRCAACVVCRSLRAQAHGAVSSSGWMRLSGPEGALTRALCLGDDPAALERLRKLSCCTFRSANAL